MDANVETTATSTSSGQYKVIASATNVNQQPVILSGTRTTQQTVTEVLSSPGSPLLATPPKGQEQVADPDEGTSPRRIIKRTAHEPKSPPVVKKAEKKKSVTVQDKSPVRKERAKSTIQQYEDMDVDMLKFSSTDTSSSGKESEQNPIAKRPSRVHQSPPKSGETTASLLKRILNPQVVSRVTR